MSCFACFVQLGTFFNQRVQGSSPCTPTNYFSRLGPQMPFGHRLRQPIATISLVAAAALPRRVPNQRGGGMIWQPSSTLSPSAIEKCRQSESSHHETARRDPPGPHSLGQSVVAASAERPSCSIVGRLRDKDEGRPEPRCQDLIWLSMPFAPAVRETPRRRR
jgi:hypothetical protein